MERTGPLQIVPYDPAWVRAYESERTLLMQLADCPFLEMEHIGSTSVPGLAAKPVIDIMASIQGLSEVDRVQATLWTLGYEDLDAGFQFRRAFHRPADAPHAAVNLHVVQAEDWPHKSERLFRDWLIAHPEAARTYQDLKLKITESDPVSLSQYTHAKGDFIQSTVNEARRAAGLAEQTDWRE